MSGAYQCKRRQALYAAERSKSTGEEREGAGNRPLWLCQGGRGWDGEREGEIERERACFLNAVMFSFNLSVTDLFLLHDCCGPAGSPPWALLRLCLLVIFSLLFVHLALLSKAFGFHPGVIGV